jgi:hypothetical protein
MMTETTDTRPIWLRAEISAAALSTAALLDLEARSRSGRALQLATWPAGSSPVAWVDLEDLARLVCPRPAYAAQIVGAASRQPRGGGITITEYELRAFPAGRARRWYRYGRDRDEVVTLAVTTSGHGAPRWMTRAAEEITQAAPTLDEARAIVARARAARWQRTPAWMTRAAEEMAGAVRTLDEARAIVARAYAAR